MAIDKAKAKKVKPKLKPKKGPSLPKDPNPPKSGQE
jgi:hypothetical protein